MVAVFSLNNLTEDEKHMLANIRRRKAEVYEEIQQLRDEIRQVTEELDGLECSRNEKVNPQTKHLSMGRKKFNMDPKKGIEYLIEHGLLNKTSEDVAAFLFEGKGLYKTAIGECLGDHNEFNQEVMRRFCERHDFRDILLVQALRQFLWSFRLPGEAQKIERLMECFADNYCQQNPDIFSTRDTCFILSYGIIMLNTSLHNKAVKESERTTLEGFIHQMRGIEANNADPDPKLLANCYESIRTEQFKIPEDDGNDLVHTFFNPDREGWLWKQGAANIGGRYGRSWKHRWFILSGHCLYYFEYTTDKEPRGIIPLENVQVRDVQDRSREFCFEIYSTDDSVIKACKKADAAGKLIEGKHISYRMSAATADEKEAWMKCLNASIAENPLYQLVQDRKKRLART